MLDSEKKSIKIILKLYNADLITEDEFFTLLENITEKNTNDTIHYYPLTIPTPPEPFIPGRDVWYTTKPYCYETTSTSGFTDNSTVNAPKNAEKDYR